MKKVTNDVLDDGPLHGAPNENIGCKLVYKTQEVADKRTTIYTFLDRLRWECAMSTSVDPHKTYVHVERLRIFPHISKERRSGLAQY